MTKKTVLPVILGVLLAAGTGLLVSQQNADDAKFVKWVDTYLDEFWKFYPTAGTLAGFTKYNDKLENWDESNIEKHLDQLDKFNAELVNKIVKDKLSPELQIDFDLIREHLDLDMFRLEKIAPQQTNPLVYNDVFLNAIRGLLTKESMPIDARLAAATSRVKALSNLVKQAKENLKTSSQEYTEAAIKGFAVILDVYKNEIPKLIEAGGAEAKTKYVAEHAKAVAALEDYGKFLQSDFLPKSTGNFRLGEAHQRTLQLTTGSTLMINDILERAKTDTKNIRREMFLTCMPYYKIMDPKFDLENPPANITQEQLFNNVIPHVLNKIKVIQPTKEEFIARIKAEVADIKAFIDKTKLLDVPAEMPKIDLVPALQRDNRIAKLITPNPYEAGSPFDIQLNPYPETLSGDALASFLDEYTSYLLPYWTIQQVYPGSFVPAVAMMKNASLVRKLSPSLPLIMGWPVYMQDMFVYAGFNNYDLKQRLNELKLKLRILIDFQLDVGIHEGGLTKEQAIRLMTITGFQTQAEAERNWETHVLNPGRGSMAYIGYQEILDMESDYKKAKGNNFSKKEFLQKLLSYGAVPIRTLKTLITQ